MGSRLFVGNLSYATNEEALRRFFDNGQRDIVEVRIITDRETGRSRGFAFVELGDPEAARSAIAELDGTELDGRPLQVKEARERGAPKSGGGSGERPGPRGPRGWDGPPRGRPTGDGSRNGSSDGRPPRGDRSHRSFEPPPSAPETEGRGGGRAERERRRSRRKKKSYDPEEEDW